MLGTFLLLVVTLLGPHDFFKNPESVVFDEPRDRYLVSNKGNGKIVQVNTIDRNEGPQTAAPIFEFFSEELTSIRGMTILNDTLYVACNAGVVGFDLITATRVMTVEIAEAAFLNDITSDSDGMLYVSDSSGHKIFKVDPLLETYTIFVGSGLNSPNGLLYDEQNNRLLVATWRFNAPIFEVDLDTGAVNEILKTGLTNLDGLAFDSEGNVYVSTWGNNSVYRFDPDFSLPGERISQGHKGPADISYNAKDNLIAIPNFNSHRVDYLRLDSLDLDSRKSHGSLKMSR